ncbi:hypothetical protein FB567DRAFT_203593 [Paraphoma chrysanthemicola]|uniref:F-box domain-containing protein n=1 Tax=Paraphoma chrysanthemicola TaxID=798071 RepID=A0A8K0VT13_9PLEO|nr:hypothetical protein FB567DRAFT_203593 [Paraphoma chrysanthemicola]
MRSRKGLSLGMFHDVEFLGETYKGRPLISLDDQDSTPRTTDEPEFERQGHFRLMDLPAELRVNIYQYLLPHNLVISHVQNGYMDRNGQRNVPRWRITPTTKTGGAVLWMIGAQHWHGAHVPHSHQHWSRVETQLFLVNKEISNEARAVLYGTNTYNFTVSGVAHHPISMSSPLIFGPFSNDNGIRLGLLRNLRSIHIEVLLNGNSHWTVKRQRARLDYFVAVLKEHSDDDNRKSLLQELRVNVRIPTVEGLSYFPPGFRISLQHAAHALKTPDKFMFGLESLATLRGIKDVKITGVAEWYAQCLQLCIQGKGGDVLETDWPLVEVKRTKNHWSKQSKKTWVSTRKWYQPTLNWKEFAERNGIEVPDNIDRFWMAER